MSRTRIATLAAGLVVLATTCPAIAQDLTGLCPCNQLPASVYLAGQIDDYALPVDAASRGPALAAAFPTAAWTDFDDPVGDQLVGHTFANLPGDIACAQLEIHLKPSSGGSGNDTLYLGLTSAQGQFAWATRLSELPGMGGVWGTQDPGPFTFDLGQLPANSVSGATSLLAKLNADHRLDIVVQDDTTVDWVRLTLHTLPLVTFDAGIADALAAPTEPTSRGSQLTAALPGVAWKDLDDTRSNRGIGHTFANLPGNIVQASLEVRAKPHLDVPGNDSLHFGLTPPNTFFFSSAIKNLPGANGTWASSTNGLTSFLFDLANLPGGSLLPKLSSDHRLDLYLQDDSAIDRIRLQLRSCPAKRRFADILSYEDVGPAISTPRGPFLDVTPTGPGRWGSDFTEINLDGVCLGFLNFCPGIGSAFDLAVNGTTSTLGPASFPVGTLSFANNGTTTDLSVLFQSPYDRYISVAVWNNQSQVVSYNGLPALPQGVVNGPVTSIAPSSCIKEFDYLGNQCFRVLLSAPTSVQILQGGPAAVGDEIRVCRDIIVGTGSQRLTSFSLTSEQPGSFTLAGALIQAFGRFIGSIGGASLTATDGAVTASNLGSSGDAGLSLHLDAANAASVRLAPIDPSGTAPVGSFIEAEGVGTLDGVPGQSLGRVRATRLAAGPRPYALDANFGGLESPTQRIQVLDHGRVVLDRAGHSGRVATSSRWPDGFASLGGEAQGDSAHYPDGTTFAIDGTTYAGDEVRVYAESVQEIGVKSELRIRAAGLDEITLTDVGVGSASGCTSGPTTLCLNGGRFAVDATFATGNGDRGQAQAIALTPDTGYFWFFAPTNVEMVVKALTGCPLNDRFWIFSAGLTNVEADLRVTDTVTGQVKHYLNPLFTPYPPKLDTGAFATCDSGNLAETASIGTTPEAAASELQGLLRELNGQASPAASQRAATATQLLLNNRFRVTATYRTPQGQTGAAQAVSLTADTGYFWFFNQANVEVIVKALNGCGVNSNFWIFAAGLTNVEVVITVVDTANGTTKTYTNPIRTDFAPIQDTAAFATCP